MFDGIGKKLLVVAIGYVVICAIARSMADTNQLKQWLLPYKLPTSA